MTHDITNDSTECHATLHRGLWIGECIDHDWNDRDIHVRHDEMHRNHSAVVEVQLIGAGGLEMLSLSYRQQFGGQLRTAFDLDFLHLQPWFDRSAEFVCPTNAEWADMVEKEIRPVFRSEKNQCLRPHCCEAIP